MNGFQIRSVELHNYRQYEGTVTADLTCTEGKHINVIQGQNGAGKSNLFSAVTLCLYGEEFHPTRQETTMGEKEDEKEAMVSQPVLEDLAVNKSASGHVRLVIGQDEPRYRLTREFETYKTAPSDCVDEVGDLELKQKIGRDWKREDTPTMIVNDILPPQISEYFLFDGERLNSFLEEDTVEEVRQGILDVSQIGLLNDGIDHLDRIEDHFRKQANDPGPEIDRLRSRRREVEREIEDLREQRDRIQENIDTAQHQIDGINEELANVDVDEVQRIQKRRTKLEAQVENDRDQLDRIREETRSLIAEGGSILYAVDAVETAENLVADLFEEGRLTPEVRDHLIDQLLEDGTCLCGADVSEGDRREHLEHMRNEAPVMLQQHMSARAELPLLLDAGEELAAEIDDNRSRIASLNAAIDDRNEQLEEISERFKQSNVTPDDVDVAKKENARNELEEDIAEFRERLGGVTTRIDEKETEREEIEAELDAAMARRDEYQSLVAKRQFASEAQERLERIRTEILGRIRSDIETRTTGYYNELIWKDDSFDVTISENYDITIRNETGEALTDSLSAGERQFLTLSFLAALEQVSGFDAPIVIDTPLGRISGKNKKRFGENFPAYLDDTQITLLVTDQEYTDDLRIRIKNSVANEYRIDYSNKTSEITEL